MKALILTGILIAGVGSAYGQNTDSFVNGNVETRPLTESPNINSTDNYAKRDRSVYSSRSVTSNDTSSDGSYDFANNLLYMEEQQNNGLLKLQP